MTTRGVAARGGTSRTEQLAGYAILGVFAIFALYPIVEIFSVALTGDSGGLRPRNFVEAWEKGHFATYLRSSLLVSCVVVVVSGLFAVLAGYAFGTMRFRGSTPLFYLLLLGMMVPAEVIVVPLFFDLRSVGLTDTYWALILPQIAQSVAFGTFWMRAFFLSTSRSLIEAARMDGAGHWRTLWSVLLPTGRPAVVTMIVIVFMWTWNEFLLPLVMVTAEGLRTAPLGLAFFQGQHTDEQNLLAAGAVIVALPIVILYLFLQRHFIRGMLEGAVKE